MGVRLAASLCPPAAMLNYSSIQIAVVYRASRLRSCRPAALHELASAKCLSHQQFVRQKTTGHAAARSNGHHRPDRKVRWLKGRVLSISAMLCMKVYRHAPGPLTDLSCQRLIEAKCTLLSGLPADATTPAECQPFAKRFA